jgi:hypothetical protein
MSSTNQWPETAAPLPLPLPLPLSFPSRSLFLCGSVFCFPIVGRFVQLQRLSVQLDRAAGILQLALGLTEQRQELGISRSRRQRRLQFLARSFRATEIEVKMGKIESRGHEGGIERERLSKLRHRFSHEIARPGGAVGDSEQKMRLRRAGVGGEDGLQFLDRLFGAARAREEAFPHAIEPLLNRRIPLRGSRSLRPERST